MKNSMKKTMSVLLAGAMLLGAAACSKKPSAEKLEKAAKDKLDAEEYSLEDLEDLSEGKGTKALKDGIVIKTNGEEIDDVYGKDIKDIDTDQIAPYMDAMGLDIDDWDTDDLGDITFYIKADGVEKLSGEKASDAVLVYAAVVEFTDKDKADEAFEDFMGNVEDGMEDSLDIDIDDLNEDEYLNDGNKGHLVINMDGDDLIDAVKVISEKSGGTANSSDLKEAKKIMGDLQIVAAFYYDNGT